MPPCSAIFFKPFSTAEPMRPPPLRIWTFQVLKARDFSGKRHFFRAFSTAEPVLPSPLRNMRIILNGLSRSECSVENPLKNFDAIQNVTGGRFFCHQVVLILKNIVVFLNRDVYSIFLTTPAKRMEPSLAVTMNRNGRSRTKSISSIIIPLPASASSV